MTVQFEILFFIKFYKSTEVVFAFKRNSDMTIVSGNSMIEGKVVQEEIGEVVMAS